SLSESLLLGVIRLTITPKIKEIINEGITGFPQNSKIVSLNNTTKDTIEPVTIEVTPPCQVALFQNFPIRIATNVPDITVELIFSIYSIILFEVRINNRDTPITKTSPIRE